MIISLILTISTAFAAGYLFSKEAIIESFNNSFSVLNITTISADDKMLIARFERRNTWDWHFFSGVVLTFSFLIMFFLSFFTKTLKNKKMYLFFIPVLLLLSISGVWLYSRIYFPISKELFSDLKIIHNFAWKIFIIQVFAHITAMWFFKIKPAIDFFENKEKNVFKNN